LDLEVWLAEMLWVADHFVCGRAGQIRNEIAILTGAKPAAPAAGEGKRRAAGGRGKRRR